MSRVANKIIQAAAGNGGEITGEFIELGPTDARGSADCTMSSAPQAGDLLIAQVGAHAHATSLTSAFTSVVAKSSTAWLGPPNNFQESSRIAYRIADGNEGTTISAATGGGGDITTAIAVYRFSSSVTGVTVAFSASQEGEGDRTIDISGYDKPHIVLCSIGSVAGDASLAMTEQDYSSRVAGNGYADVAGALFNLDSTTDSSEITATNVNVNEACTYAVLVPTFD